jgi:hypothetical protein
MRITRKVKGRKTYKKRTSSKRRNISKRRNVSKKYKLSGGGLLDFFDSKELKQARAILKEKDDLLLQKIKDYLLALKETGSNTTESMNTDSLKKEIIKLNDERKNYINGNEKLNGDELLQKTMFTVEDIINAVKSCVNVAPTNAKEEMIGLPSVRRENVGPASIGPASIVPASIGPASIVPSSMEKENVAADSMMTSKVM